MKPAGNAVCVEEKTQCAKIVRRETGTNSVADNKHELFSGYFAHSEKLPPHYLTHARSADISQVKC
jgi:hypothetical protein